MTRKEKIQKLVSDLQELDNLQQGADWLQHDLQDRVKKLKLTKRDLKFFGEEYEEWKDIESWLEDSEII